MPKTTLDLPVPENVCLALIAQETRHGWSIVKELEPTGELGRIAPLSRALTYRALEQLETRKLIARDTNDRSAGSTRARIMLTATAAGRRQSARWLAEPVTDLAALGGEFLLKATLLGRAGGDVVALLDAQQAVLAELVDEQGNERGDSDLVDVWMQERARAAQRFFHRARAELTGRPQHADVKPLRLSARNQLHATVDAIHDGDVLTTVRLVLPDGQRVSSTITKEAVRELDLTTGAAVLVIVKSTEVMIAR